MAVIDKEELTRRENVAKETSFKAFMAQPTIRILISKMPSTEPELLEALLKEAHDRGFGSGAGANAAMFIEVMMRRERDHK